jgi:hypothetical protein
MVNSTRHFLFGMRNAIFVKHLSSPADRKISIPEIQRVECTMGKYVMEHNNRCWIVT